MTHPSPPLELAPRTDVPQLARRFADRRRVQIREFLAPGSAAALHGFLAAHEGWRHVINGDERVFEIPSGHFDAMAGAERASLDQAMFTKAKDGFQFQFDTIRVVDGRADRNASGTLLDAFADLMAATDTLALFEAVTGASDIRFADAQATRYRAGDFLTRHDDAVADKNRRLAYVLNLSPAWRPEWGGLLLFNGEGDAVVEAMAPCFNTLSLFAIGQPHSVSYVAPYAGAPRLSVTGWLRAQAAPP